MKLFLDTGIVQEVHQAAQWGMLDGVTTNPTLIARSGKGFKETVLKICDALPNGDISAEIVAVDYDNMLKESLEISSWHPNIVIKVPMNKDGMRLVNVLSQRNIRTNVTLIFTLNQALLAAKAGATYISYFVGRIDDISGEGMDSIESAVNMIYEYGYESEILVASIRHPLHVVQSIQYGAHVATMPYKVMEMMFNHPLTESGTIQFLDDWNKANLNIF